MKYIFHYLSILVLFTIAIQAVPKTYCNSQCSIGIDEFGGQTQDLNCTLPNKNATMPITVLDVFEADGKTLKKYFGTGETVCNVLGWFNYENKEKNNLQLN